MAQITDLTIMGVPGPARQLESSSSSSMSSSSSRSSSSSISSSSSSSSGSSSSSSSSGSSSSSSSSSGSSSSSSSSISSSSSSGSSSSSVSSSSSSSSGSSSSSSESSSSSSEKSSSSSSSKSSSSSSSSVSSSSSSESSSSSSGSSDSSTSSASSSFAIDFIGVPTSGTAPLNVVFTPQINGTTSSYLWEFGDGYISSDDNPLHIYTEEGFYDVSLTATYLPQTPGIHVTEAGYVTLTTNVDYLNGLRNGKFGFVAILVPESGNDNNDTLWDSQVGPAPADPVLYYKGAPVTDVGFFWNGGTDLDHTLTPVFDTTNDWILATSGVKSWSSFNGEAVDEQAYAALIAANSNTIRIGADADDPTDHTGSVAFGFYAILDLSSVAVDATFAQNLSNAVHSARINNWSDPEEIRLAILDVDSDIKGVFWKLKEAGFSGAANSLTVTRYNISDGMRDVVIGGTTGPSGCTGYLISSADAEITGNRTKLNYIRVLDSSPYLPENDCCFGPYSITCLDCSSGSGTTWYDSSKSYKECNNIDCSLSCESEYGLLWNVIQDYADDCPSCRECYLEHNSQLNRQYTLTVTNCEVYITDFVPSSNCGTCLERAEDFCFQISTDPNSQTVIACKSVFEFDDHIFMVEGTLGECISGEDCGTCWQASNALLGEDITFLPESPESCSDEIITSETTDEISSSGSVLTEIIWHNKPDSEEGKGTDCTSQDYIPSEDVFENKDDLRSFRRSQITTVPSGQSFIAYEEIDKNGMTKIKIAEKHTSVKNNVVNSRALAVGRIQQGSQSNLATLFIDDSIIVGESDDVEKFGLGFKNGPYSKGDYAGKIFPINSIQKQPIETSIYTNSNFVNFYLDISNGQIYAITGASSGSCVQFNIDGTGTSTLFSVSYGRNVYFDSSSNLIYFLHRDNVSKYIKSYSLDSQVTTTLNTIASSEEMYALDVDETNEKIYYIVPGTDIRSMNLDGTGDASVFATTDTYVPSVKYYNNYVYWIETTSIRRCRSNGSDSSTIVSDLYQPWGLDVVNNRIYWSENREKRSNLRSSFIDGSDIQLSHTLLSDDKDGRQVRVNINNNTIFWSQTLENLTSGSILSSIISERMFYEIKFNPSETWTSS